MMKIAIYCQFEEETANGILMKGRARALASLGHDVSLIYQPFKYKRLLPGNKEKSQPGLEKWSVYSRFFSCPMPLKPVFLPALFIQIFRIFLRLRTRRLVILHKALPLSLFYLVLLKSTFYRGKTVCILDDWEGVGGFASIRNSDNFFNKMLVTASEEWVPPHVDALVCVSKLLYDRMGLSRLTKDKSLYLPNGADPLTDAQAAAIRPGLGEFRVGYVGTFKNQWLINFLLDIVDAAKKRDSGLKFVFIGGGDLFGLLENEIDRRGLRQEIQTTNQIPRKEVDSHLLSASVCLLVLSDAYPDAYVDASRSSAKLFEYMAYGKLVVATDFGEPKNILKEGVTGFLLKNDAELFAGKIVELKRNRERYSVVGENASKLFREELNHVRLMQKMMAWLYPGSPNG